MKYVSIGLLCLWITVKECFTNVSPPIVMTKNGGVRGFCENLRGTEVCKFLGIPYVEKPIGSLRYARPKPKSPWDGTLDATKFGPACIQRGFGAQAKSRQSEDCLYLNIFTSLEALTEKSNIVMAHLKLRPVLIWIHGGAFTWGSAFPIDGSAFVVMENVIVVTIHYRLWVHGFLSLPKHGIYGNMGLWDQYEAISWVKLNIMAFGGDPDRITLMGESAGSQSVSAHMVSPFSRVLFQNAVLMSGSLMLNKRWLHPGVDERFLARTGCNKPGKVSVKSCLEKFDVTTMDDAGDFTFWPKFGDEFIPLTLEAAMTSGVYHLTANVMVGALSKEAALMLYIRDSGFFNATHPPSLSYDDARKVLGQLLGDKFIDFYTELYLDHTWDSEKLLDGVNNALGDVILFCPTYMFAKYFAKLSTGSVYAYLQDEKPCKVIYPPSKESTWFGATHTDDIYMAFGAPFISFEGSCCHDIVLSRNMLHIWATFAREGKPPTQGLREWPRFTKWFGSIGMSAMILNSQRIGHIEIDRLKICEKQWPFPVDGPYILERKIEHVSSHSHANEL